MTTCPECKSNRIKRINADRRMTPPEDLHECVDCGNVWLCEDQLSPFYGHRSAAVRAYSSSLSCRG